MKRGFTLIELLVVIGILAILTAAVVVVLNPAELLRQARDAQRLSDFDSLRSAVSLYLATAAAPALGGTINCTVGIEAPGGGVCVTNAATTVDGNGWVMVALTDAVGGSPLSALPLDPVQDATNFYAYAASTTALTFELNGHLESSKYDSRMSSDGGDNSEWYELGTYSGLDLMP
jgi:prepilin-type N-terminal cleavage/methylation domain-containing protein